MHAHFQPPPQKRCTSMLVTLLLIPKNWKQSRQRSKVDCTNKLWASIELATKKATKVKELYLYSPINKFHKHNVK